MGSDGRYSTPRSSPILTASSAETRRVSTSQASPTPAAIAGTERHRAAANLTVNRLAHRRGSSHREHPIRTSPISTIPASTIPILTWTDSQPIATNQASTSRTAPHPTEPHRAAPPPTGSHPTAPHPTGSTRNEMALADVPQSGPLPAEAAAPTANPAAPLLNAGLTPDLAVTAPSATDLAATAPSATDLAAADLAWMTASQRAPVQPSRTLVKSTVPKSTVPKSTVLRWTLVNLSGLVRRKAELTLSLGWPTGMARSGVAPAPWTLVTTGHCPRAGPAGTTAQAHHARRTGAVRSGQPECPTQVCQRHRPTETRPRWTPTPCACRQRKRLPCPS
jgi:hypothetical protein